MFTIIILIILLIRRRLDDDAIVARVLEREAKLVRRLRLDERDLRRWVRRLRKVLDEPPPTALAVKK